MARAVKRAADNTHQREATNNCADVVDDTINAAGDVDVNDKTIPIDYHTQLFSKFPDCAVIQ